MKVAGIILISVGIVMVMGMFIGGKINSYLFFPIIFGVALLFERSYKLSKANENELVNFPKLRVTASAFAIWAVLSIFTKLALYGILIAGGIAAAIIIYIVVKSKKNAK